MPNRFLCDVLNEMRECTKTLNFSYLLGLIGESQALANRMEAKLEDIEEIEFLHVRIRELKKEKKKLEKQVDELDEINT